MKAEAMCSFWTSPSPLLEEQEAPRNKAREREAEERETRGYEPFALHAPPYNALYRGG